MKVSRLFGRLIGLLGVGAEVTDWEVSGSARGALSTLISSGADGGQSSWEGSGGPGGPSGAGVGSAESRWSAKEKKSGTSPTFEDRIEGMIPIKSAGKTRPAGKRVTNGPFVD
jgi:hypothetical protein